MRETRGWFEFGLEMADEDEESDAVRRDREGRDEEWIPNNQRSLEVPQ